MQGLFCAATGHSGMIILLSLLSANQKCFENPAGGCNVSVQLMHFCTIIIQLPIMQSNSILLQHKTDGMNLHLARLMKMSPLPCLLSFHLPILVHYGDSFYSISALVDSGLAVNIIHCQLTEDLKLPITQRAIPLKITTADNQGTASSPH